MKRIGVALVVAAALVLAGWSGTWAHGDDHPTDKLITGQLTGKTDRTVRIDGREFALHPRVVLEDDEGRPKLLQEFMPHMYVRYQLRDDRVKQLILVTPK
jgi:hypothetical protein